MEKITIVLLNSIKKQSGHFGYIKNLFKNKTTISKQEKQLKGRLLRYRRKDIDPIF